VRLAGTLHVSLPSDIIQFFGTSSVPAIVAGSVLGVFELGERFASQRAKDALSKWLVSFDVQKAKALPDGTQELFERIFGERHFSVKCFIRSAVFSLGAMAFIAILIFLIDPTAASGITDEIFLHSDWLLVTLWLPWCIVIDYLSLFKTRIILGVLTRLRRATQMIAVAILGIDYLFYKVIFIFGFELVLQLGMKIRDGTSFKWGSLFFGGFLYSQGVGMFFIPHHIDLISILFWSGFAPSLWMWLYVLALFVTRALLRSERIVNWLRWFLDVDKNPFRSIGAVAAALAFIASVVIILVSAEVSRISSV
jgi:hypothetical protein